MRKFLSLLLALMMVASVAVVAVSAADTDAAGNAATETATVTLYNIKGESVTQTYAVGDTVTAYTYMNVSNLGEGSKKGKIASINGSQEFDPDILTLADAYDDDPDSYDYGLIDDVPAMLPVCGSGGIANAGHSGVIYYNASSPTGFSYNTDTSAMIITHYTVTAPGTTSIVNKMQTLALADDNLTRVVDRGTVVQTNFTSPIALSDPILPIETGSTVSGAITSYIRDEAVTVELLQNDAVVYTATTEAGKNVSYSIDGVADGDYILRVSKPDHATRDYEITVSGDTVQDAKICPMGDVSGDGKVTTKDSAVANAAAMKTSPLTGYALKCGDVVKNDGKVTTADASRINAHAMKTSFIWVA